MVVVVMLVVVLVVVVLVLVLLKSVVDTIGEVTELLFTGGPSATTPPSGQHSFAP